MSNSYDDLIFDNGFNLINFYRQHPIIAAKELLGVELDVIQRAIFRDMWFKQYCLLVMGRGAGKSIHTNTLSIIEGKGICHLNEILPPIPTYLEDGTTEERDCNESVYTSIGFRNTKQMSLEKNISGRFITTQKGFELRCGITHPLLTINNEGNFVYKVVTDFLPGDAICIQRNQGYWSNNYIPIEDGYLIGQLIGDGSIANPYTPSITTADDETKQFCIDYCKKNNISYRLDNDSRTKNTSKIYFKQFNYFFEKYEIKRCLSYYKVVPFSVRTSNKESQKAFLQGYFDSDGCIDKRGIVSCSSVSKQLLQEIQVMLLNFGIVSKLREKKTKSTFGKAYFIEIGSTAILIFNKEIGFRLKRKQQKLSNYINIKILNPNIDTIPFIKKIVGEIIDDFRKLNKKNIDNDFINHSRYKFKKYNRNNFKEFTYNSLDSFIKDIDFFIENGRNLSFKSLQNIDVLKNILSSNYYFDKIKTNEAWIGDCYDFEMDMGENNVEPNYFANGFISHNTYMLGLMASLTAMLYPGQKVGIMSGASFRQAKMVFAEVERLYNSSPIFRQACKKPPVHGSDSHYVEFKNVRGIGSMIQALPIGDSGATIRGSRFYLILMDELAQVDPKVLDLVIRPMSATTRNPMERVKEIERRKRLVEAGLATADSFSEFEVNRLIMASSGYFKFNHMWNRMCDYWNQIDISLENGEVPKHAVWQVPYSDMSPGFLDLDSVDEAIRNMSDIEFRMEYMAEMIRDSEGFFKASVIENCSQDKFQIEITGDSSSQYVIGVDPNQGGSADCAIIVLKISKENYKVVYAETINSIAHKNVSRAIKKLCRHFNIVGIFIDKGGGGNSVAERLAEDDDEPVLLTIGEEAHFNKQGRRIVNLINFSTSWITDANFSTRTMLEGKKLLFPPSPILALSDVYGEVFETILKLKMQLLNIVVTPNLSGTLHFDTPKKGQKKDLYSSLLLAAYGAYVMEKEADLNKPANVYSDSGYIRQRETTDWRVLGGPTDTPLVTSARFSEATLKIKIKK